MKRMFLLAVALALVGPAIASAAPAPDNGTAHVYLGHIEPNGTLSRTDGASFTGVPAIKTSAESDSVTALPSPVAITCHGGATLRAENSPRARAIGRLTSGAEVKLVAYRNWYGSAWGEVQIGDARVLVSADYLRSGDAVAIFENSEPCDDPRDPPLVDRSPDTGAQLRCYRLRF